MLQVDKILEKKSTRKMAKTLFLLVENEERLW